MALATSSVSILQQNRNMSTWNHLDDSEHPRAAATTKPETALSRGLLNASKLHILDDEVRKIVERLTPAELTNLLAVVSKQPHFDLLGLPADVRLMIYELVFRTQRGQVFPLQGLNKKYRMSGLGLLCASKLVHGKAFHISTRVNKCGLHIGRYRPKYEPTFTTGVRNFMRLDIHIPTEWSIALPQTKRFGQKHPASKLETVFKMLKASHTDSEAQPQAHVTFNVHMTLTQLYVASANKGLLDPKQTFDRRFRQCEGWQVRADVGFIQAQLSNMVDLVRRRVQLPTNVTVTTNAEQPIAGVETVREDEERVRFRIRTERK